MKRRWCRDRASSKFCGCLQKDRSDRGVGNSSRLCSRLCFYICLRVVAHHHGVSVVWAGFVDHHI